MSKIKNFETLYTKFSTWESEDLETKLDDLNKELATMVDLGDLDKTLEQMEVIAVILKERRDNGAQ